MSKTHKKCKKGQKYPKKCSIFGFFLASFSRTYTHFVCHSDSLHQTKNIFVTVTQCNKQNKSLSQWVSATNNIEQFFPFLCGMWPRNWETKPKNKHPLKFEFHHRYQIALEFLLEQIKDLEQIYQNEHNKHL